MKNYTTAMNAYTTAQRAAGLSPNSIASYTQTLRFYGAFCEEHSYDPETPQAVLNYKEALFSGGNAQSTIKLRMIHLKEFFAFCAELGYAETNPCAKFVTKVGRIRKQPYGNLLTQPEIAALCRRERPAGATRSTWARNYAIMITLLTTAMRNSELRYMTLEDIDFDAGYISLTITKGSKYRQVALPEITANAIRAYLASGIRPEDAPDDAPLFGSMVDGAWEPFSRQGLTELVNRHVRLVTGREGIRSHAIRHASASYMLSHGMSLEDIQALLGHSDVKTTQIYSERLFPTAPTEKANIVFSAVAAG